MVATKFISGVSASAAPMIAASSSCAKMGNHNTEKTVVLWGTALAVPFFVLSYLFDLLLLIDSLLPLCSVILLLAGLLLLLQTGLMQCR